MDIAGPVIRRQNAYVLYKYPTTVHLLLVNILTDPFYSRINGFLRPFQTLDATIGGG